MLRVGQQPLEARLRRRRRGRGQHDRAGRWRSTRAQPILIGAEAAADRPAQRCFNGKIEAPRIAGVAAWDFARRMDTLEIEDSGPNGLHGRLVNLPTRAMKGAAWTGEERDWKRAPHQYAAIHFHDDDLHDCGWADDFSFTVPKDMKQRRLRHAAALRAASRRHPVLRAPADRQAARQGRAIIASTFTYQVYTNFSRGLFNEPFRQRVADWKAAANNPDDHKDYGLSTYNYPSRRLGRGLLLAPAALADLAADFLTFNDAAGSGLRHLPADTHLTGWLDRMGIAYDVVTDHDLHEKGVELLALLQGRADRHASGVPHRATRSMRCRPTPRPAGG